MSTTEDVRRDVTRLEENVMELWRRMTERRDPGSARLAEASKGLRTAARALEPGTLYDGLLGRDETDRCWR